MSRSGWLEASFGWLLSTGIHVLLLLGAALVVLEYLTPVDGYTDFGLGMEGGAPRIEPLPEPWDSYEKRRLVQETPIVPGEIDGGAEESSGPAGFWIPARDSGIFANLPESADPGTFGPTVCNLEFASNRRVSLLRSEGTFSTSGPWCRYPGGRPLCRLGSAQVQSLVWLARHQNPDGGWSASGFAFCCDRGSCSGAGDPAFDTGVTGLSLLAFLGAGYSQLSKDQLIDKQDLRRELHPGAVVKKGLQWLLARQDAEGCIGPPGPRFLYNHAIATLALCEAYGMTAAQPLHEPAQKAVDFLVAAQNPGAGWRYGVRGGESDTSVTAWAVMALKSAELSGLTFPQSAYEGAVSWLNRVTSTASGVGYNAPDSGKVFIPGKNEWFE